MYAIPNRWKNMILTGNFPLEVYSAIVIMHDIRNINEKPNNCSFLLPKNEIIKLNK
jgi:hypothetical protein